MDRSQHQCDSSHTENGAIPDGKSEMTETSRLRIDAILARVTFGANAFLFAIKIIASTLTGSMAVIASAVVGLALKYKD